MLDIGWQELFIIALVGVIVVGPKDLPHAIRTFARIIRKIRSMANEFQRGLDDVVRDAELEEIRKDFKSVSSMDMGKEIEKTIDPTGTLREDLNMSDVASDLDSATRSLEDRNEPATTAVPEPAVAPEKMEASKPTRVSRPRRKTAESDGAGGTAAKSKPKADARKPATGAKKSAAPKAAGTTTARKPRASATKTTS